jgi:hypothetical protein
LERRLSLVSRTIGHTHRRYVGEKEWHAENTSRRDTRRARDPETTSPEEQPIMSMMHGHEKTLSNTGCPWPGGPEVMFARSDIVQLGKLYCWGSACVQFIVRLRDNREVFVRADKQDREDERFLRRLARPIRGWAPDRSEGFRTVWGLSIEEPR